MRMRYHVGTNTTIGNANLNKAMVMPVFLLISALLSNDTLADERLRLTGINKNSIVFTFNSKQASAIPQRKINTPQFFNSDQLSLETQLAAQHDPHLAFNDLWMRQNQDHYRYSDGGAAIGRLFRMGIKTWYKSYRDSNKNIGLPNENGGGSISSEVDYRLKLSSGRVKLALEYEF